MIKLKRNILSIDKVVGIIAGFGIPGLVLLIAVAVSSLLAHERDGNKELRGMLATEQEKTKMMLPDPKKKAGFFSFMRRD